MFGLGIGVVNKPCTFMLGEGDVTDVGLEGDEEDMENGKADA
jgi:hypothetical protein